MGTFANARAKAGEGSRTPDLLFTRQVLYQLSYSGKMASASQGSSFVTVGNNGRVGKMGSSDSPPTGRGYSGRSLDFSNVPVALMR